MPACNWGAVPPTLMHLHPAVVSNEVFPGQNRAKYGNVNIKVPTKMEVYTCLYPNSKLESPAWLNFSLFFVKIMWSCESNYGSLVVIEGRYRSTSENALLVSCNDTRVGGQVDSSHKPTRSLQCGATIHSWWGLRWLGCQNYTKPTKQDHESSCISNTPLKINMEPKNGRFWRWFSFSNRWFSSSMLIFQGVCSIVAVAPPPMLLTDLSCHTSNQIAM